MGDFFTWPSELYSSMDKKGLESLWNVSVNTEGYISDSYTSGNWSASDAAQGYCLTTKIHRVTLD